MKVSFVRRVPKEIAQLGLDRTIFTLLQFPFTWQFPYSDFLLGKQLRFFRFFLRPLAVTISSPLAEGGWLTCRSLGGDRAQKKTFLTNFRFFSDTDKYPNFAPISFILGVQMGDGSPKACAKGNCATRSGSEDIDMWISPWGRILVYTTVALAAISIQFFCIRDIGAC